MRRILLLLLITVLVSCNKEEQDEVKIIGYKEYAMIVASQKRQGIVGIGVNLLSDVYAVKIGEVQEWQPFS